MPPFRRYFEAPEDQGVIVVPEEPTDSVDAEQLIVDRINEVNSNADAAERGEVVTPDSTDSEGEGVEDTEQQPTAEELILGRFRSPDDVITAYQNLEPQYTQTRQQLRDMERQIEELQTRLEQNNQEWEEDQDFHFTGVLNDNPSNMEELESLAEQHPERAAMWAINNAQRLDSNLVSEVLNYWHQRNPAQATAYMVQQMMGQYTPQFEQRLAPHDTSAQERVIESAVTEAEKQIGPSYGEYHDRIVDAFEANPALLPQDVNDPQAMSQSIVNVYAMLVGMDQLQRGKQLAAQGAPTPAPQPATTQTRPTAGANVPSNGASDEDIEAARQIQQLILNAQA